MEDFFILKLESYIREKNLSVRKFEEKASITQGTIAKAIKNGTAFSYKVLQQIRETYPDLDINWLLSNDPPHTFEEIITSTHP